MGYATSRISIHINEFVGKIIINVVNIAFAIYDITHYSFLVSLQYAEFNFGCVPY